jgi:hypothetical protein
VKEFGQYGARRGQWQSKLTESLTASHVPRVVAIEAGQQGASVGQSPNVHVQRAVASVAL